MPPLERGTDGGPRPRSNGVHRLDPRVRPPADGDERCDGRPTGRRERPPDPGPRRAHATADRGTAHGRRSGLDPGQTQASPVRPADRFTFSFHVSPPKLLRLLFDVIFTRTLDAPGRPAGPWRDPSGRPTTAVRAGHRAQLDRRPGHRSSSTCPGPRAAATGVGRAASVSSWTRCISARCCRGGRGWIGAALDPHAVLNDGDHGPDTCRSPRGYERRASSYQLLLASCYGFGSHHLHPG